MPNLRPIVVFDMETDGTDPTVCSPVQIAAKVIAPRTLEFVKDAVYQGFARPPDIDEPDYYEKHSETLDFHSKNSGTPAKEIFETWKTYPPLQQTWESFTAFVKRYRFKIPNESPNPIPAGHNIVGFDLRIVDRLCVKYGPAYRGDQNLFYKRDQIDLLPLLFMWFENNKQLENYQLDTVCDYLGLKRKAKHDALHDADATGQILIRFLQLTRKVAAQTGFKDAFKRGRN